MKIITIVRTLNEEHNVDMFCQSYAWADEILVADGGSTDSTKKLLKNYDNVTVRDFKEKTKLPDGSFCNPRGKHINFLIDWGLNEGADILIFDDFDCVPNYMLQRGARTLLKDLPVMNAMMFVPRMHIYGTDQWFPKMTPAPSLWAWASSVPIRADEDSYTISMKIPNNHRLELESPPDALLHYFYPSEEILQRKKAQYVQTGEVLDDYNPLQQFGKREPLPDWATWK